VSQPRRRSGSGRQLNHWKMSSALEVVDSQLKLDAALALDGGGWLGALTIDWPSQAGFKARSFIGRWLVGTHLDGGSPSQPAMRPVQVVPGDVDADLFPCLAEMQGNEDSPGSLVLQGSHEAFDHRDAAMLPDGSVARGDPSSLAGARPRYSAYPVRPAIVDEACWQSLPCPMYVSWPLTQLIWPGRLPTGQSWSSLLAMGEGPTRWVSAAYGPPGKSVRTR